jgi:hypothetical protein
MTELRTRMVADGVVAGVLGYLVVVIFFVILDVAGGSPPLHTAAVLGTALFGGSPGPSGAVDMGVVLAFNGFHLMAVLGFAFYSAWLMYEAERHPDLWYVALFAFLAAAVIGYAAVLAGMALVRAELSPWLVASAGVLSALAVGGYLAVSHRPLLRAIGDASAPGQSAV